jgi:hypothetical protein
VGKQSKRSPALEDERSRELLYQTKNYRNSRKAKEQLI